MGLVYLTKAISPDNIFKVGIAQTIKHCAVRFAFHGHDGYKGLLFNTTGKDGCVVFDCQEAYTALEKEIQTMYSQYRVYKTELYINSAEKRDYLFDEIKRFLVDHSGEPIDIEKIIKIKIDKDVSKKTIDETYEEQYDEDQLARKEDTAQVESAILEMNATRNYILPIPRKILELIPPCGRALRAIDVFVEGESEPRRLKISQGCNLTGISGLYKEHKIIIGVKPYTFNKKTVVWDYKDEQLHIAFK
ncbi:MAG: hypothetical protein LBM78_03425 [Clostridiales bacterium]|jgi:hypothetical protein|nr:hypothetical protein [Clostridiales bacterium]